MVHFDALATDIDGTIAHDGHVDDITLAALQRARGRIPSCAWRIANFLSILGFAMHM
jgi:hypothetical protein